MKTMKNLVKSLIIALAFSTSAFASGIPTVDAAVISTTIAENLKTITQLKEQLNAINSQIEQAKQFADDTKNRLEGNWKLSDVINNDQFLNALPKDARDILTDGMSIAGLRNKYGLKTDNVVLQKEFDCLMAYRERTEQNYKNTVKRLNNIKKIKILSDAATTPAQKADVANKLALLQLEFAQEQTALKQAEDQFKAQREIERNADIENFRKSIRQGRNNYHNTFSK